MGVAPYKSAKEGGEHSFSSASAFNQKECPCHVYSDSMLLKQTSGQTFLPL